MVGTTYGYHYGGPGGRSDRYRNVTSKASGLRIRHSGNTKQASSMQFKSKYDKLDATTKSALDKFTNKPDSQLTSAERDSLYHIEPWFYLQYVRSNHPNKVEFHRDRLKSFTGFKRNMEDNGLVPKESSETQAAKQMVENIEAPVEQAKPAETNTNQPAITPEKQAAQDMVDSSKPAKPYAPYKENMRKQGVAKSADYPEFTELPMSNYYPLAYADGVYTPHLHTNSLNNSNTRRASNYPTEKYFFDDGQYPFEAYEGMGNVEFVPMYNPHYPRERLFSRPEDYYPNPFEKRRYDVAIDRYPDIPETQRKLKDTAEVLGIGLGSIGLLGYIGGQQAQERQKQSQTQVPYRTELEPVNEDIPQAEPILEQQYAAQDIPSLNTKIDNLFDLYRQQEQLMREKEIAASQAYQNALDMGQRIATGTGYAPELKESNFVSSQKLPPIGATLDNVDSPDTADIPEELDTPLLRNASWDLRKIADDANKLLPMPSQSRQKGVRPPLKSGYRIESNNPVQTETRNNAVTAEQVAANQMVNQYAGIPIEVARAKNSGYTPPFLTTDAIWDRVRKAGLSSPEQAIRSGLFTPAEVRYITENDLWRYR